MLGLFIIGTLFSLIIVIVLTLRYGIDSKSKSFYQERQSEFESRKRKYPFANIYSYSSLFFSIGLFVSLALVFTAFTWSFESPEELPEYITTSTISEEIPLVPLTKMTPPPPPPKVKHLDNIKETDDIDIDIPVEIKLEDIPDIKVNDITDNFRTVDIVRFEEEDQTVFEIVEEPAVFEGGIKAFYKYISRELEYPRLARQMGIEGKVIVEFVIDKQGKVSQIRTLKGINKACDAEAIRVISNSPDWLPAKQRGKPVNVRMRIPISFKIGE